jgi:catechol-2,3-dioxygenase
MAEVTGLGHVALVVREIGRAVDFYTGVVGLHVTERTAGGEVYLRCGREHHCLVLIPGGVAGLDHTAYEAPSGEALEALDAAVRARGVPVERRPVGAGIAGEGLWFRDPEGLLVVLYAGMSEAEPPAAARAVQPRKLGHLNFKWTDLARTERFYREALGFKLSDWRGDVGVWLRCNPDHHGVAGVKTPRAGLHHHAYELTDWGDVKRACDWLLAHDIAVEAGPLRHGPGNNISIYFFDPEGIRIELFCEILQIWDDESYRPRDWPTDPPNFDLWRRAAPPPTWYQ